MASVLRFRKLCYIEPTLRSYKSSETTKDEKPKDDKKQEKNQTIEEHKNKIKKKGWRCVDLCCRFIGCMCTTWWLLLFLYHCLPANLAGLKGPESPGARLKNEGLTPLHPVVIVPGIVTGGLELWEGKPCSQGLFRKRIWLGSFSEIFKRFEYIDHLSILNF